MRSSIASRTALRAAVAGTLLLAGCKAAYQLDLPGTSWEIVSVADESLDLPRPFAFSEDLDSARLTLDCGDVDLLWVWDSDGSAIGFGVEDRDPACADASASDAEVLDALTGAEEWSVQSDREITIRGEQVLRLTR
jgi:hypothetical protein